MGVLVLSGRLKSTATTPYLSLHKNKIIQNSNIKYFKMIYTIPIPNCTEWSLYQLCLQISSTPFEIVEERPSQISRHITSVNCNGFENFINVRVEVVDTVLVVQLTSARAKSILGYDYFWIPILVFNPLKQFPETPRNWS